MRDTSNDYGLPDTTPDAVNISDKDTPPLLPLARFAHLHLQHILAHPPDSVLFPFLHGLEGDNHAQNTFFSSSSSSHVYPSRVGAKVPRYRGLVWVVCEEDLDSDPRKYKRELSVLRRKRDGGFGDVDPDIDVNMTGGSPSTAGAESESGGESELEDDDDDDEMEDEATERWRRDGVQGEAGRVSVVEAMDIDTEEGSRFNGIAIRVGEDGKDDGKHMHPVVQRPAPIQTLNLPSSYGSTDSTDLSTSFTTTASSDSDGFSFSPFGASPTPTPTSTTSANADTNISAKPVFTTTSEPNPTITHPTAAPKPSATIAPPPPASASASAKDRPLPPPPQLGTIPSRNSTPSSPDLALLTCTFRPSEIIRKVKVKKEAVEEEVWEFVPSRVPDGISLRNFGIQVPIYATLSDIVVYSPKGPTPNTHALARNLREAVRRKWEERLERLGGMPEGCEGGTHPDLLNYNVFVLNANSAAMQSDAGGIPHLVMRLCGDGVPGAASLASSVAGSITGSDAGGGAHTDGPDGHLVDMDRVDGLGGAMYVDVDTDMEMVDGVGAGMDVDTGASKLEERLSQNQNPAETPITTLLQAHTYIQPHANAHALNTVDFALREKEEMRDLTKASEIISVCPADGDEGHAHHTIKPGGRAQPPCTGRGTTWMPSVGQVFLGNSEDVPLTLDGPGRFRMAGGELGWGLGEEDGKRGDAGEGGEKRWEENPEGPFNYRATNDPLRGFGYDICIECHDLAPFPTAAHLRAAEEHLTMLDLVWVKRAIKTREGKGKEAERAGGTDADAEWEGAFPPRPPPNANAVIHLPFPSSPPNTQISMSSLMPFIRFLEKWLTPVAPPPSSVSTQKSTHAHSPPPIPSSGSSGSGPGPGSTSTSGSGSAARRWSSVTALMPHFPSFPGSSSSKPPQEQQQQQQPPAPGPARTRSFTSPPVPTTHAPVISSRTRPIKVLIYSADGYTESSVPALCLLMAVKRLSLPEAYLELQVAKRRSFFVYQSDLGVLKRVESRLREDRERDRVEKERERIRKAEAADEEGGEVAVNGNGKRVAAAAAAVAAPPVRQGSWGLGGAPGESGGIGWRSPPRAPLGPPPTPPQAQQVIMGRPAAKSVSFGHAPLRLPPQIVLPQQSSPLSPSGSARGHGSPQNGMMSETVPATIGPGAMIQGVKGRPRANTSPWLPSLFGDHQSWFNDSRFDGSFPSRVLPFLYLGNLNHAANAYMLHALGITHVVSVGECALIPPPHSGVTHHNSYFTSSSPYQHSPPGAHYSPGKGHGQGSLWFEEREGRIKVLDIKGVCDDGIDTLEPQLEPICDWIDQARLEGGQVLVHCRVGVSRSATVTIAYVMKHLGLPLVDAYLIVRSRRLSVLIQPNMRLLYNLCGWEIKLAKARAGDDEDSLRRELVRTLSWPYLAKEVHALNEKYLH